jgi:hypothetical protein
MHANKWYNFSTHCILLQEVSVKKIVAPVIIVIISVLLVLFAVVPFLRK